MPLLSISESARELAISRKSVERFIRLSRLPSVRIGRRILIDPTDLARFIAARRQPGTRAVESAEQVTAWWDGTGTAKI